MCFIWFVGEFGFVEVFGLFVLGRCFYLYSNLRGGNRVEVFRKGEGSISWGGYLGRIYLFLYIFY